MTIKGGGLYDLPKRFYNNLYYRIMGSVTPEELKEYRVKLGISQKNLAESTGLSPNTIALYESGSFPTTTNNKLLKSLINNDEVLSQYMINDSKNYSTELVSKIDRYFQNEDSVIGVEKEAPRYTAVQLANWVRVEITLKENLI